MKGDKPPPTYFNPQPPRVLRGERIEYMRDGMDVAEAVVVSHGWKDTERILFLDNGEWCYHVVRVVEHERKKDG